MSTMADLAPQYGTKRSSEHWEVGEVHQHWEVGECWLYCERPDVWVMWLGPAACLGVHGHVFACADCVYRLTAKIHASRHQHYPYTSRSYALTSTGRRP